MINENSEEQINVWFQNKTKLYNKSDLMILYNYITNKMKNALIPIHISGDYKFEYIAAQFKNIRPENTFKLSWLLICAKLREYFPEINIDVTFETCSSNDNSIQKGNATFKHDVMIEVTNNNRIYDCAIEYNETMSHKRKAIDNNKELYVQQLVDNYIVYKENTDINNFFLNTIHKVMLLICASCDDHYTLAKINFFKNNQSNLKKLKKQTELFNKIITFNKMNKFNFMDFYKELQPVNTDTEEKFEMDSFIEYLEENYDIIINIDKKGYCMYNIFSSIIVMLDCNISDRLSAYKQIYLEAMTIMFDSMKEINRYINESTSKKNNMPEFLNIFMTNHIMNYRNPYALTKAKENLNVII